MYDKSSSSSSEDQANQSAFIKKLDQSKLMPSPKQLEKAQKIATSYESDDMKMFSLGIDKELYKVGDEDENL